MDIATILAIVLPILGVLIGGFLSIIYSMRKNAQEAERRIQERVEGAERQHKVEKEVIDEKLGKNEQSLTTKKEAIEKMIQEMRSEIQKSREKIDQSEKESSVHFARLQKDMEKHSQYTADLFETTQNLKNVLSNNRLRGKWGEEIAETIIQSIGFVKGESYCANQQVETGQTRPDFTIILPNKTKINIDAKFPYDALMRHQEAETETEKSRHLNDFKTAIKTKVKEVTTRDYINEEENTVDFVIMFIPNEMIFSFIYENLNNEWSEGMKKKVILAGPFSFSAILRTIYQSYRNFAYEQNIREIIKLIQTFEKEYTKMSDAVDAVGKHLENAVKKHTELTTTRDKKLSSVVEKITSDTTMKDIEKDTQKPPSLKSV